MKNYFSLNVKHLRVKHKLSQQAFAEAIGKKRSVVGSYEKGEAEPSISLLLKIADFFGVRLTDLIERDMRQ